MCGLWGVILIVVVQGFVYEGNCEDMFCLRGTDRDLDFLWFNSYTPNLLG